MQKKKTIITSNREVYEKLNMLNISSEVVVQSSKPRHINRIINTINKNNNVVLECENLGKYILLKKKSPVNYNVFFSRKR